MTYFTCIFILNLQNPVYFTLTAHLSLNTKLSLEILDRWLDFIEVRVEKVGSYISVVLTVLKSFPITESSVSFLS